MQTRSILSEKRLHTLIVYPTRSSQLVLTVVDSRSSNHLVFFLQVWVEELGVMEVIWQFFPFIHIFDFFSMANVAFASKPRDGMNFGVNRGHQESMIIRRSSRNLFEQNDSIRVIRIRTTRARKSDQHFRSFRWTTAKAGQSRVLTSVGL